jgi:eukaryotic-like serine/threonine-protein kinase
VGEGCLDDERLLAFLNGALPAASRGDIEAHLASCRTCTDLTTWTAADLASRKRVPGDSSRPMIGELAIGSQVARYRILGPLGRGGMGEVYAAYHPDLERRIALKIVDESGPDSAERRARLLREARAIARLSHPNVVTVHDAGTVGDRVYIAMELVDGETVDHWLRGARRTWREVLEVFIAAGRGLAAAHAAEIVHRDFKPQNIMIGKDGSVRVMDFGLARLVNDDLPSGARPDISSATADRGPATVTKTGALLGTPAYMAPEQFRGEPSDPRSDQFSYCVALHEALYGVRPRLAHLETEGPMAAAPPTTPNARRGGVPAWLRAAVLRGLHQDPAQRFASMNQLLLVLDRGRSRLRRRVTGAAAGLAGALAVLGGWRISHPRQYECKPLPGRLAAAWPGPGSGAARRESLHRTLLASGRREAPAIWQQLSSALDDHLGRWTAMYQETCEATHARGEQSEEVLDLRMRCLGKNLDEIRALTDVLIAADARVVGQAVSAAGGLTPVTVCADVATLRSTVPLPRDEQSRLAVEGLQRRLNDVRALRDVGYTQVALERARALRPEVEAARYAPLMAELLVATGLIEIDFGNFGGAEVALKDAFVAAEAGNDDATRADAASTLVSAIGQLGRWEESDLWAREANAILDRLGAGHSRARAWVLNNQALVLEATGDFAPARRAFEKAIALKLQSTGPKHPDVAMSFLGLGLALKGLGDLEAALAAEDRALALWTEQGNSWAAKAENNRGEILALLGRHTEAEQAFQRAMEGLERDTGPENIQLSYPLTGLADVKLATGHPTAAVPLFERALRIRERKETNPVLLAETRFGLARALWAAGGSRERALRLARSARVGYDNGHYRNELARLDAWLQAGQAGRRAR